MRIADGQFDLPSWEGSLVLQWCNVSDVAWHGMTVLQSVTTSRMFTAKDWDGIFYLVSGPASVVRAARPAALLPSIALLGGAFRECVNALDIIAKPSGVDEIRDAVQSDLSRLKRKEEFTPLLIK